MFSGGLKTFFEDGGWGMFPTLAFGFFLVGKAVLYGLRPQPRAWPALGAFFLTTLGAGTLGTLVGLINTLRFVAREEQEPLKALAVGAAESSNNLVLALILAMVAGVAVTVGLVRAERAQA